MSVKNWIFVLHGRPFLALGLMIAGTGQGPGETQNEHLRQAYDDMYNLNFSGAHRAIAEFRKTHPDDPLGPVSDAAACLFSEFQHLRILESEFFVDDSQITDDHPLTPDPKVKADFDQDIDDAARLTKSQMNDPNKRANAMFAETLRLGLHADYLALIEKRDFAALAEMKKGRQLAEQLVSKYAGYDDAYIAVGVENYLLSLKPAPVRWVLRATGAETDKEAGVDKLRQTAEHGTYLGPYARLLLAVAALRDGNRLKARELLYWLAARYPSNTLYKQELAKLR